MGSYLLADACPDACQNIAASRFTTNDDRIPAFQRRLGADCLRTLGQKYNNITKENNGDEKEVPDFAAQFSKGLEHDEATGLLTYSGQKNYKRLLKAIRTGSQTAYNSIARAHVATRRFTNPQGSATFSLEGADSSLFSIPLFPKISSPEAAAELIELYLMELCRDVLFSDYGTGLGTDANGFGGSLTNDAASVLQDLGAAYIGPRNPQTNEVDASVLFRGNSSGNLIGPYVSQYLWIPLKTIPKTIFGPALNVNSLQTNSPFDPQGVFTQMLQLRPIAQDREFGIKFLDFVAIQNGAIPEPYQSSDYDQVLKRYIVTGRDMASYVHCDTPYEEYYNALNVLFSAGFKLSPYSPYANGTIINEDPFVSLGYFDIYAAVGGVAVEAAKAAWAQKWRAQRVLRPEAFAGLVNNAKVSGTNPFNLSDLFFDTHAGIDVLALVQDHNAANVNGAPTYLLSQVYPEASPLHPSYPSGHATIAGACITVIKAFFDDQALISSLIPPVKPDPNDPAVLVPLTSQEGRDLLTVASELDKLAFNVGNGRNFAGIHYRADAEFGVRLGEQVAIKYLQDRAVTYSETTFAGFQLTTVDGVRIRITADKVVAI